MLVFALWRNTGVLYALASKYTGSFGFGIGDFSSRFFLFLLGGVLLVCFVMGAQSFCIHSSLGSARYAAR